MSNHTLASGFVRSALQNGVGRYVCQLQRLTIKFCKSFGASRGVRDFVEKDLVDFARNNPGVVVYLKPRRHRSPVLDAEYLNGEKDYINCHNFTREEVVKYTEYLKNKSGYPIVRLRKFWHTDTPSIQGVWTPFLHLDPEMNTRTFPDPECSRAIVNQLTATDILQIIAKENAEKSPKDNTPQNIVCEDGK